MDLLRDVVQAFLTDIPDQFARLEQTIAVRDREQAERLCHSIKGAAASIGGEQLRAAMAALERTAKAADWARFQEMLPHVESSHSELRSALEAFLG